MQPKMKQCPLCGQYIPELLYDLHRTVDDLVVSRMKRDFPGWSERDGVCAPCLDRYRNLSATRMTRCPLCGQEVPELLYDLHRAVDDLIVSRMKRDFPGWSERDGVCGPCLDRYKGMSHPFRGVQFTDNAITSIYIP